MTERPSDLVKDTLPEVSLDGSKPRANEDDLWEAMKDVVDPELGVNVVDLGLVYAIHVDEENNAIVDMTLTSPTCPLTDRLEYDTVIALHELVETTRINWVWIPAWNLSMITDDGREQLRALGMAI